VQADGDRAHFYAGAEKVEIKQSNAWGAVNPRIGRRREYPVMGNRKRQAVLAISQQNQKGTLNW
jgi:hypothetical protein